MGSFSHVECVGLVVGLQLHVSCVVVAVALAGVGSGPGGMVVGQVAW